MVIVGCAGFVTNCVLLHSSFNAGNIEGILYQKPRHYSTYEVKFRQTPFDESDPYQNKVSLLLMDFQPYAPKTFSSPLTVRSTNVPLCLLVLGNGCI